MFTCNFTDEQQEQFLAWMRRVSHTCSLWSLNHYDYAIPAYEVQDHIQKDLNVAASHLGLKGADVHWNIFVGQGPISGDQYAYVEPICENSELMFGLAEELQALHTFQQGYVGP